MINVEKTSPIQIIYLLSLSRISIVLLTFQFSNQDFWIIEIFSPFYVALLYAPLLFLSKQFANQTILEYLSITTGKLPGKILGILYVVFFLYVATLDLSLFDNIIKPINFPETPDYAIIFLALATCAYCVNKGLECIARAAEIFTPLIFTVIVFYAILQIPDMDFKVFLPILADSSVWHINSQAFIAAARINDIIMLAMLAPSLNKKGHTNRIFFWTAIIITIFSLIVMVSTVSGLGLDVPKKTFDPYYLFIKQIHIYDFITRIEFLIVAAWNIGMFLKISLLLYLASLGFVQIWGLKSRKIVIIPIVIVIFFAALKTTILKSVIVFKIIEVYAPYINLIFIFGIPVIVLALVFLKKYQSEKQLG